MPAVTEYQCRKCGDTEMISVRFLHEGGKAGDSPKSHPCPKCGTDMEAVEGSTIFMHGRRKNSVPSPQEKKTESLAGKSAKRLTKKEKSWALAAFLGSILLLLLHDFGSCDYSQSECIAESVGYVLGGLLLISALGSIPIGIWYLYSKNRHELPLVISWTLFAVMVIIALL